MFRWVARFARVRRWMRGSSLRDAWGPGCRWRSIDGGYWLTAPRRQFAPRADRRRPAPPGLRRAVASAQRTKLACRWCIVDLQPPAVGPRPLRDLVERALAARHFSPRTCKAYTGWIRRFVRFH